MYLGMFYLSFTSNLLGKKFMIYYKINTQYKKML